MVAQQGAAQKKKESAKDATDVELSFRAGFLTLFSSGFGLFYCHVWKGLSCTAAGEYYWGGKYFDCLAERKNVQAFTIQSPGDFLGQDFSADEIIRNFRAWTITPAAQ